MKPAKNPIMVDRSMRQNVGSNCCVRADRELAPAPVDPKMQTDDFLACIEAKRTTLPAEINRMQSLIVAREPRLTRSAR
jgi:hypothetical protein